MSTALYEPGVSGSYASAPDSAALSITGDIDLRERVALGNWTPAVVQYLIAKSASTQRSYSFRVEVTGRLGFLISSDGTTESAVTSTVNPSVANNAPLWVRVTWRQSDGRVQFFTAPGSISTPVSSDWTQLGADRTIAIASNFDSTNVLELGTRNTGTAVSAALRIYRAQIRSNILDDGTGIVFDADFTPQTPGATSFTESSVNAATVTINGTARIARIDVVPYLWLPGLSGSYASTPDSAALSITGDIDIRVKVAMDKWTPSGSPVLAAKWVATLNQRSYSFWLFSDGKLHLQLSSDGNSGATAPDIAANAATGFADGSTNWVRVTWRQSDGRTQFWKSADGASWTQIGTDVTNAASSIFDSTASLEIGAQAGGTVQPAAGKFYRVQIRSNILDDGTGIVFDEDFTTETEGATTVTESSANAATVTINGFALITSLWAAAPVTAATTASTTDGTLFATPSWTPKTGRLYLLCCTYSAAVTASTPTCSGNSITWTAIRSDEFGTLGSTVFAAISTGGTAGATTLSFGATHTGCIIHVIEVDGADLSGSAAAAIPHHSGYVTADGVSSPQSGALGVVPAVANRTFSVWGTTGTAATPRASWVELADSTYSTPTTGQEVQWRPDASEQTGSITFSGSLKVRGIGLEIRAAQDPLPQHIVAPSGAVQRAANW